MDDNHNFGVGRRNWCWDAGRKRMASATLSTTNRSVLRPLIWTLSLGSAIASAFVWAGIRWWWLQEDKQRRRQLLVEEEWQRRRQEERTGRIRAEQRLRTALKELQQLQIQHQDLLQQEQQQQQQDQQHQQSRDVAGLVEDEESRDILQQGELQKHYKGDNPDRNFRPQKMVLDCIGYVVSPYTKRMGTPRQPQLVPASRGYIQFHIPSATLSGIDQYSHIWVLFEFHAKTDLPASGRAPTSRKTKIRPPRGGGIKVGQLATRSPHRPNPLGLSLVTVARWDEKRGQLHITGLDLVHQTPVYDVKPCVPWDIPGYFQYQQKGSDDAFSSILSSLIKVPDWVDRDDSLANSDFTPTATQQLHELVTQGRLAPLYTEQNDGYRAALETLKQVLAQDPRSSHRGLKTNARGSVTATSAHATVSSPDSDNKSASPNLYHLIFGLCQVSFVATTDGILVTQIAAIDFDPSSYVDGIPLISSNLVEN